jgi:hypothetical protein
MLSMLTK